MGRGYGSRRFLAKGSLDPPPPDTHCRCLLARNLRHERDGGWKRDAVEDRTARRRGKDHHSEHRQASALGSTLLGRRGRVDDEHLGDLGCVTRRRRRRRIRHLPERHTPRDHDRQVVHLPRPDLRHDVQGRSGRLRRSPAPIGHRVRPRRNGALRRQQPRRVRLGTCTSPAGARPGSPSSGASRPTTSVSPATASTATASRSPPRNSPPPGSEASSAAPPIRSPSKRTTRPVTLLPGRARSGRLLPAPTRAHPPRRTTSACLVRRNPRSPWPGSRRWTTAAWPSTGCR